MAKGSNESTDTYEKASSFVSLLSGWVQQGLESFFATQRIIVDLAMRQNTTALKTIREGLSEAETEDSPLSILTEVAAEGTANYIEAQRILLDLAQQENEIVMKGVKEHVGDYSTALAMTNVIRRSINTFVEMQQNFLTIASKHTQGLLRDSEEGEEEEEQEEGTGILGIASEAMDEFIATQKKFFDLLSEETGESAENKKEHVSKKSKVELTELGREAADTFIEAQKKLLDLASQQVNVNMQGVKRALDLKMPIRILPMADIASESVKSFVDAEKALVDSMMKARTNGTEDTEEETPAKKHRQTKPAARRRTKAASRSKAARTTHEEPELVEA